TALALIAWIASPTHFVSGALLVLAGGLQSARLTRWAGDRTFSDRLVLVLHIGYAFVPLGFLLIGLSTLTPTIPPTAGVHAWTAGAIGLMTLAIMTRASLGHTGQPLQAGYATQSIYLAVLISALARIAAAFASSIELLEFAGFSWTVGFTIFVLVYGPLLAARKPAWAG